MIFRSWRVIILTLNETFPLGQAFYMVNNCLSRSFVFFDVERRPMAHRYAVLKFEHALGALIGIATKEIDYCWPRLLLYIQGHKITQCH